MHIPSIRTRTVRKQPPLLNPLPTAAPEAPYLAKNDVLVTNQDTGTQPFSTASCNILSLGLHNQG